MKLLESLRKLMPTSKRGRVTWARKEDLPVDDVNPLFIVPALAVSKSYSTNVELQELLQKAILTNHANSIVDAYAESDHDIIRGANYKSISATPKKENE